jgi:2-dehydropantoate 2-reductase
MQSSMQRDANAGQPLELDAIGGAVVREAARHGITVRVTSRYVDEKRARYPR